MNATNPVEVLHREHIHINTDRNINKHVCDARSGRKINEGVSDYPPCSSVQGPNRASHGFCRKHGLVVNEFCQQAAKPMPLPCPRASAMYTAHQICIKMTPESHS
ncbi:unnamed protein product [Victoria cruziana]